MYRNVVLLLALTMIAVPAAAAPFRTPDLDAASTWEVKPGFEWESARGESELGYELDITAPLRQGLETSLTLGRGRLTSDGFAHQSGWHDTELAIKWEAIPISDGDGFGVSMEPAMVVPSRGSDLSDNAWQVEVPVIFGWNRGRFGIRTLVGYGQSLDGGDGEIALNQLLLYHVNDAVKVGLELASTAPTARMRDYDSEINAGVTWEFAEGLAFKARVGRSLHRAGGHETNTAIFLEKAFR